MQNPSSTGHDTHYTLNYSGVSITGAETYGHTIQPSTSGYHSHGLSHHSHPSQGIKRNTQQAGLDKGVSLGLSSDEDDITPSGSEDHSPYIIPSQVPIGVNVSCANMNDGRNIPNNRSLAGNSPNNDILHPPVNKGPIGPNGKKTKGRVKIKMEFIDNKLRRYTTFSKRKTGIMKKAYELSTLTGTQVMLLVASETGHVYTFATRKLQPMITSEAGKALIQTCLNSPDPSPDHRGADQRMTPSGFEETELSYTVNDEDQKSEPQSPKSESSESTNDSLGYEGYSKNQSKPDNAIVSSIPMQISTSNGLTTIISTGGNANSNCSRSTLPGTVMYHTAQGVVYATPSGNHLQHSLLLEDGIANSRPILTVPVPVSMTPHDKVSSKCKK